MTESEGIDLNEWRQGDFVLGEIDLPLLSTEDDQLAVIYTAENCGVAVLSQSCDIVRSHIDKPYLQVASLIAASEADLGAVSANTRPRYGFIPGAAKHGLVVDFDIAATVDKEVVATWKREQGCITDDEQRAFSAQLSRHRARFAFPDAFNGILKPMRRWIEGKRSASSSAGELVRAIEEIRVACDNWDAPTSMTYLFIVEARPDPDVEAAWYKAVATLEQREVPEPYPKPSFRIATWDDISAREYLMSDRLDMDGLSDS